MQRVVAPAIGVSLELAMGVLYTIFGLDRDRAPYPAVAIEIAPYQALFAVMGASTHTLALELLAGAVFLLSAVFGCSSSLWIVLAALAAHGISDLVHGSSLPNPGVPTWWPAFCLAYNVTAAAYLSWLLKSRRVHAAA